MQIRVARHAGFCFGVKRAVEMALSAADPARPVYTLGEKIGRASCRERVCQYV
jgi:4-hydroxy-3-methylbut-2-enyl diphosphate reductase IspH